MILFELFAVFTAFVLGFLCFVAAGRFSWEYVEDFCSKDKPHPPATITGTLLFFITLCYGMPFDFFEPVYALIAAVIAFIINFINCAIVEKSKEVRSYWVAFLTQLFVLGVAFFFYIIVLFVVFNIAIMIDIH